jgi:hypothetical protein
VRQQVSEGAFGPPRLTLRKSLWLSHNAAFLCSTNSSTGREQLLGFGGRDKTSRAASAWTGEMGVRRFVGQLADATSTTATATASGRESAPQLAPHPATAAAKSASHAARAPIAWGSSIVVLSGRHPGCVERLNGWYPVCQYDGMLAAARLNGLLFVYARANTKAVGGGRNVQVGVTTPHPEPHPRPHPEHSLATCTRACGWRRTLTLSQSVQEPTTNSHLGPDPRRNHHPCAGGCDDGHSFGAYSMVRFQCGELLPWSSRVRRQGAPEYDGQSHLHHDQPPHTHAHARVRWSVALASRSTAPHARTRPSTMASGFHAHVHAHAAHAHAHARLQWSVAGRTRTHALGSSHRQKR